MILESENDYADFVTICAGLPTVVLTITIKNNCLNDSGSYRKILESENDILYILCQYVLFKLFWVILKDTGIRKCLVECFESKHKCASP